MRRTTAYIAPAVLLAVPFAASAQAQTLAQAAGIIDTVAGFMFVASILLFITGFFTSVVFHGTEHSEGGVLRMEWGVATLFTLILLLLVARFIRTQANVVVFILAAAVLALVIYIGAATFGSPPQKEEKKPAAGAGHA